MAMGRIRQHLDKLKRGQMFSSRDMVGHGRRNNVDVSLHRLHKAKVITRVAQGVYIKGDRKTPKPGIEEIATFKGAAFEKTITKISIKLAAALKQDCDRTATAHFTTNGRSSRIRTCHGPIQYMGASLRKASLGDTKVGIALRTAWHLARGHYSSEIFRHTATNWGPKDWDECERRIRVLPQWLSEILGLPSFRLGADNCLLE